MDLKKLIRNVPDFPKAGIQFKDITTLLKDGAGFKESIEKMAEPWKDKKIDKVAAIEARGFIIGAPIAEKLGAGLVLVRKKCKLPSKTLTVTYELEYGEDTLEVHEDSLREGDNVLIVDDLLATGGTAAAAIKLVKSAGAEIAGLSFLIELKGLNGQDMFGGYPVNTLISYEGV
ncbi:MAG: adenine phosphoribosyltransferase [Elusimicrobiota bacterium]|nr:adenine phosphoribosyltransferase [Elusimicrobiota bacterium]